MVSSEIVSPVVTFFMPPIATISPALAGSTSSRLLACISIRRPTRSLFSLIVFVDVGTGFDRAGIDAHESKLPEVLVRH